MLTVQIRLLFPDWIQNYKDKVIRFVEDAITNNAYEEI